MSRHRCAVAGSMRGEKAMSASSLGGRAAITCSASNVFAEPSDVAAVSATRESASAIRIARLRSDTRSRGTSFTSAAINAAVPPAMRMDCGS